MKKVKRIVAFVLCTILLLALSVSAFADSPTVYVSDDDHGLYDGKSVTLENHTDVVVRQTAGGAKWPSNGTLWLGYSLVVVDANCARINLLDWSEISPKNDVNPTYVHDGFSASYLLN